MSGSRRILTLAATFAALLPIAFRGQVKTEPRPKLGPPPAESRPSANLRIDTNLVLVPVSVCDPQNRPVTGLEKEHFRVLDDHVEQTITHFSMDDEPVAVGLVRHPGALSRLIDAERVGESSTSLPLDTVFTYEERDPFDLQIQPDEWQRRRHE